MRNLKKFLALALCAVMVLGLFAACKKAPAKGDSSVDPTEERNTSGIVVLNAGAIFSIRYDLEGTVDSITGDNDYGVAIVEDYTDFEGKTCGDVIKELIILSAEEEALTEEVSTVMINVVNSDYYSKEKNHDELLGPAQEGLDDVKSAAILMIIDESNLTGEGYLTMATVKQLLINKLGIDKFDAFYGDTTPRNNYYVITIELDGVQYSYTIDAYYGAISVATREDLLDSPDDEPQTEATEETSPTEFQEEVAPTIPAANVEEGDIEVPIS